MLLVKDISIACAINQRRLKLQRGLQDDESPELPQGTILGAQSGFAAFPAFPH